MVGVDRRGVRKAAPVSLIAAAAAAVIGQVGDPVEGLNAIDRLVGVGMSLGVALGFAGLLFRYQRRALLDATSGAQAERAGHHAEIDGLRHRLDQIASQLDLERERCDKAIDLLRAEHRACQDEAHQMRLRATELEAQVAAMQQRLLGDGPPP